MAKSQWSFKTAVEQSAALAAKTVSAVELAQDAIARIERHDNKINAICVRDFDRGLEAARAAHTVHWHWVKGHSGHELNDRADQLVRDARDELKAGR